MNESPRPMHLAASVSSFVNSAVAASVGPIFPIALTLIYYDQRIRLEGYDIEQMMDAAGMNPPGDESRPVAVTDPVMLEELKG